MPNKTYALEWLQLAIKNLETANFLYQNNHYTDIIAVELQQALEKMMKSCYAFHNKKIPRIHELVALLDFCKNYIKIDENYFELCEIASEYYKDNRYPSPQYSIPERSEIESILNMASALFSRIKDYIKNYNDN